MTRRTARSIIRCGVVALWTDRDLIRTTGHAPGQILGVIEAQCALEGRGRMASATVTRAGPLTGWVDSCQKRWAAEEAAHTVRGVEAVANDIEVRLLVTAERAVVDIATAVITVRAAWSAPGVTTVENRIAIAP